MTFNVHEAKTRLSELIAQAEAGQEVIIARAGKPSVRLVPVKDPPTRRVPGSARGQFTVSDDFNDPLPEEILREFYK